MLILAKVFNLKKSVSKRKIWMESFQRRDLLLRLESTRKGRFPPQREGESRSFSTSTPPVLHSWLVTGLIDAEGCFNLIITKSSSVLGWRVQARFVLELHAKDIQLLYQLKSFFSEVGTITVQNNKKVARYSIVGLDDILKILLPHFSNYPLQSFKKIDFLLWKNCVIIMSNKEHLTLKGIKKILSNKTAINLGLPDTLKAAFPDIHPLDRPVYNPTDLLNPNWISGFITGDGSFNITINSKDQVNPKVCITLHIREKLLLEKVQQSIGFGSIYTSGNKVDWIVFRIDQLLIIIPYFKTYPLGGLKAYNFNIWQEIVYLLKLKEHLTLEGLAKVKSSSGRPCCGTAGVKRTIK